MKIPKRPALVSTTLPGQELYDDSPVFFYEPPRPAEAADFLDEIFGLDDVVQELLEAEEAAEAGVEAPEEAAERPRRSGSLLGGFCALFDRQIRRIDRLEIEGEDGDEPFDPAKHLDDIPAGWKIAIGKEIFGRIKQPLTGSERGN